MINPSDTDTMKALSESRQEELLFLARKTEFSEGWQLAENVTPSRVSPIRRSVGIRLMRAGARLAGVCLQPELSRQS